RGYCGLVAVGFGAEGWAGGRMAIVQILKGGLKIAGKPLLDTPGKVWLANATLGVSGVVIAATQSDVPLLAAVIQAVLAVFAASGEHEFLGMTEKLGKESTSESKQNGTE